MGNGREEAPQVKAVQAGMRRLLYAAAALVLLAGLDLFILTDHTDWYFAWTIKPGLTAAFLGAGYLGAFFLEFLAAREREWARARIAVPAVLGFTVLTLVVTIIHRDRFHFHSPHPVARFWTWAWLAIYVLVPIIMVVLLVVQAKAQGTDPPRRRTIPGWGVVTLAVEGGVLLAVGAILLVSPSRAASWWPWALTPLTGRAIGAWLVGLGIAAAHGVLGRDIDRFRPAAAASAVLGALELIAVLRYRSDVNWHGPGAWVYLGFAAGILAIGAFGWASARGGAALHEPSPRIR